MERRGFLKGLIGGVTSAGLLVKATPAEVQAFTAPLVREAPIVIGELPAHVDITARMPLFDVSGRLVAYVRSVAMGFEDIDVTYLGYPDRHYIAGPACATLTADIVPSASITWREGTDGAWDLNSTSRLLRRKP